MIGISVHVDIKCFTQNKSMNNHLKFGRHFMGHSVDIHCQIKTSMCCAVLILDILTYNKCFIHFEGMLLIYSHTKFHMPICKHTLVIIIRSKGKIYISQQPSYYFSFFTKGKSLMKINPLV
jgi:hypothetical protein